MYEWWCAGYGLRPITLDETAKVFRTLVRAAVETKVLLYTLWPQEGLCGLIDEFCALWAESVVEVEMCTVDSEDTLGASVSWASRLWALPERTTGDFVINEEVRVWPDKLLLRIEAITPIQWITNCLYAPVS